MKHREHHQSDVLVVGGGASASFAALRARELGAEVNLVDKSVFGRSGCAALASGALRVYFPGDNIEQNLKGRGDLVDEKLAIEEIRAYTDVYHRLEDAGVRFVKENGKLWRGRSGGHGALDAGLLGGGPAMMMAVRREALEQGIRVFDRIMIIDVLTSDGKLPTNESVIGAIGVGVRDSKIHIFEAKASIICAGGFGFPFSKFGQPFAGMPINLSGDGVSAEFRAGAVMGNMAISGLYFHAAEFFTAPGLEHLSIQGAKWVNRLGEDVMEKYLSADGRSTGRSTLGVAMALESRAGRGPVYLDCTHFKPEQFSFLWDVIPIIMSNFERAGYDLTKDKIPYLQAVSSVHGASYSAGAVIDWKGKTSIPGLYAAGTSSNAMNVRMNLSLPECFVTGLWAGEEAANYARGITHHQMAVEDQIRTLEEEILKPLEKENSQRISYEAAHEMLAQIFIDLGSIPNTTKLNDALRRLERLNREIVPNVHASDPHNLMKVLSDRNSALIFVMILKYLLHRTESRGSTINEDYPETDNDNWLKWTQSVLREDGRIEIWDVPIPASAHLNRTPFKGKRLHPLFDFPKS